MKEKKTLTIHVYDTGIEDFLVDIIYDDERCEAWLYDKNTGCKEYMFGNNRDENGERITAERFIEMVECNLEEDIELYKDRHLMA